MDYLGYQFWSGQFIVPNVMTLTENINHKQVKLTVLGDLNGLFSPKENIRLYLFNPSGVYLGKSQTTNSSGEAFFNLPQKSYRIRADYLGSQYLSENFTWQDANITIAEGTARIHVHNQSGDVTGCRIYLFSDGGSYLSQYRTTDSSGMASFILPNKPFKFRADMNGMQYMSQAHTIEPGTVTSVDMNIE
jgi:filamentous hemagglutinin family protein